MTPRHLLGITRFACLNMGFPVRDRGWNDWRQRPGVNPEWVWRPARLEYRLDLLATFGAPTMAAMRVPEGYTYQHVVVTSEGLPEWAFARLEALLPSHAAVLPVRPETGMKPALRRLMAPGRETFTFRLDDDDALTPDYFDDVAACWEIGRPLAPEFGYYMAGVRDQLAVNRRVIPLIAIGLGYYHTDRTIHDLGQHTRIAHARSLRHRPYWLRTIHAANDSHAVYNALRRNLGPVEEALRDHFPQIDPVAAATVLNRRVG